jgi:hypothetical protein
MIAMRTFTAKRATRVPSVPLLLAALLALGSALVVALSGCGGGSATAGGSPAATAAGAGGGSGSTARAQHILHEYAQCVRRHGFPNFPDPRINAQGEVVLGAAQQQIKQAGLQTEHACGNILSQLPPRAGQQSGPVTPAQLALERRFAACMRQHGLPAWPDPGPDGSFRLSTTPYATMGKTGPVLTALNACRPYENFGGVRGS